MKNKLGYLERMEKAMEEKLFFLEKVDFKDVDCIVDFGCANGALIGYINEFLHNKKKIIGYDNFQYFIDICNNKYINNKNLIFLSQYKSLLNQINGLSYAIIFSSCLHELSNEDFEKALFLMKNSKMVIIRDMYFDEKENLKLKSPPNLSKIKQKQITDFEREHGKIDNLKNLYHIYLKYTYEENWESEVKENYFSVDYARIFKELSDFKVFFDQPYTLPFKKEEILREFDYELTKPTHRRLILIKK